MAWCLGDLPAQSLPAGLEIKIGVQPEKATVGDPITIDFNIALPHGAQIRFPQFGAQIGDFTVLDSFPGPSVPGSKDTALPAEGLGHRARIVVALYKVGEFEFPSLQLMLRDSEGKETTISTPTVRIQIQSVLTEKDEALKDLKQQADIPEPVRWVFWLALTLLFFVLAALAWWWWQRKRRPALPVPTLPQVDPFVSAEAELRDLLGRRLLEGGFVKEFYVALAEIVKKVLEAGYGIPTVEKTTGEIIESLRDESLQSIVEDIPRIESLLSSCDLVKFAKYIPARAESDSAVKDALQILKSCKKPKSLPTTSTPVPATETP